MKISVFLSRNLLRKRRSNVAPDERAKRGRKTNGDDSVSPALIENVKMLPDIVSFEKAGDFAFSKPFVSLQKAWIPKKMPRRKVGASVRDEDTLKKFR
ncbi:hypothetical protein RUM43_004703 [Polyplax serrata]|uniref:Uncharacterized protein n=1 Tax=Polyplax serrata TaxID=468196 RepID=A0AAN8SC24_POLSC